MSNLRRHGIRRAGGRRTRSRTSIRDEHPIGTPMSFAIEDGIGRPDGEAASPPESGTRPERTEAERVGNPNDEMPLDEKKLRKKPPPA